jgi:pyruvate dehydrogenase (quinone)
MKGAGAVLAQQVPDYVLGRLREWDVQRVYGYPGDGINGLLGAFGRAAGDPEFIQPRHEEMAAFMACAHAKFTGEPGCCMATSGPGAIHLLNGLYDAKMDHQPVVAIVGQQKRISQGAHYQQEVALENLFADAGWRGSARMLRSRAAVAAPGVSAGARAVRSEHG